MQSCSKANKQVFVIVIVFEAHCVGLMLNIFYFYFLLKCNAVCTTDMNDDNHVEC